MVTKLTAKMLDSDGEKTFTQTFNKIKNDVTDSAAAALGKAYAAVSTGDALVKMQKISTSDILIDD